MDSFLKMIVDHKREELLGQKRSIGIRALETSAHFGGSPRPFKEALTSAEGIQVIAEIKRASPLKGPLCAGLNVQRTALEYTEGGACAISVVTDRRFFGGDLTLISLVKTASPLPVLRKDFIIDEYQIYESRAYGADAVLLIVSILPEKMLGELLRLSHSLGMDCLVEVHTEDELRRALDAGAAIVGINNRDLSTFRVDLQVTLGLAGQIPREKIVVSESGIKDRQHMILLEGAGVNAALVGEALIRTRDKAAKLKELLGKGPCDEDQDQDLRHHKCRGCTEGG